MFSRTNNGKIMSGAKFVFIGSLWIYRLSIGGEAGVRHVMNALFAEFNIFLNVNRVLLKRLIMMRSNRYRTPPT
ncbi:hypothetical protein BJ878DRAFT_507708 [Calycina marina]|uniref:FMN-dependent dehydrogenase domain-containing protein n=1 Tax=Calycina marina TaxID=1763456 RepID=A0A9P8CG59_9HELO|nr:hypothetical protein BJ878DRAFT_507708 [Calycina marina]